MIKYIYIYINMSEDLKNNILKWVQLNNEISSLQSKIREFKKEQKIVGNNLTSMMKEHDLDVIDINSGEIKYVQNKVKQTLNQKYLLDIMTKYYNNIGEANKICEYIQDNREIKFKDNIKFKKK